VDIVTLQIQLSGWHRGAHAWSRVIEIPEDASLDELHHTIQDLIGFDNDHLYEFFAGRTSRHRKIEFGEPASSLEDSSYGSILLSDVFPLDRLKLYYRFDFGDDWLFEITRRRGKRSPGTSVKYPKVIEKTGRNPSQYG
jgi:hypothetical protein